MLLDNPGCPLSLWGHADPIGTDVYNKSLSERRARAVYALLIYQSEQAVAEGYWRDISATENWGAAQRQRMQDLVNAYRVPSRGSLMSTYMSILAQPAPLLQKTDFLAQGAGDDRKGDFQGCSEFNPLFVFSQEKQAQFTQAKQQNDQPGILERNRENAVNRRVLGLLFRKGSKVDPVQWPCPRAANGIAGCTARFWPDGDARRATQLQGADRRFEHNQDTFACRFYQRIAGTSPCEFPGASGTPVWIATVPTFGSEQVFLVIRDSSGTEIQRTQVDTVASGPDDSRRFDLSGLDPTVQHTIEYVHGDGDRFLVPVLSLSIDALRNAISQGSTDGVRRHLLPSAAAAPPARPLAFAEEAESTDPAPPGEI
jgi:hypothetical protein